MKRHGKVIIAVDSFKGSLTSREAGEAVAEGVRLAWPGAEAVVIPVADGGEGTVEAIVDALGGTLESVRVAGPLGLPATARYGLCGDTAVIEMASASGLTLIPQELRNPFLTSTFGTGQIIRDALSRSCRNFLIGLGGSATNDAGTGMLRALGFRFLDADGREVPDGGGYAGHIREIDDSAVVPELREATFTVACDVSNPLTGPQGASHVFGPQKGASPEMAEALDQALASFARVTAEKYGKDLSAIPGTGAAGGLGFAFLSYLNATLRPGIDMVLDAVRFDALIADADLVMTGEGRLDRQTLMGKTPCGVLRHARAKGIPVTAIGGCIEQGAEKTLLDAGFRSVHCATPEGMPLDEAMRPSAAAENVKLAAAGIIRGFQMGSSR